jgi:hypothetical protein
MSRRPPRSILAGLAMTVLTLTLACIPWRTEETVRMVPGGSPMQQDVVQHAMEWAYDKVDFGFCRDQKCLVLVEVATATEGDVPDVQACVIRHILAANGRVVDQASEATLKLTSIIERVQHQHDQPMFGADKEIAEFTGRLEVTGFGPGAATRVFRLYGLHRKSE